MQEALLAADTVRTALWDLSIYLVPRDLVGLLFQTARKPVPQPDARSFLVPQNIRCIQSNFPDISPSCLPAHEHHPRNLLASLNQKTCSASMCEYELIGDYYRGCQHFHGRYHSGERFDCNNPHCKTSSAHVHSQGSNCGCPAVETDRNRVQNMFYTKHEDCQRQ
ncbi:hypothetical protein DAEQUDRAFT_712829 [Daedalea quercina L-15889]|uniref:Uncharacterized protein n=1 Tax=Daedalea quercina L-15889 TaxID=1314783 RepID=A0A165P8L0_9APHY|nr:hypothetical protein DAEQUDRAFT_712829 [Daedalea quercina L-15889]